MLVANGANPNLLDAVGVSPLTRAVSRQNLEMIKVLVENGAKINAPDGNGYLPFHYAVRSSDAKVFKYFLKIGTPLNLRNVDGNNAMEMALGIKKHPALKMLFVI